MNRVRLTAATVSTLAAILATVGSFLPLFSAILPLYSPTETGVGVDAFEVVITSWSIDTADGITAGAVPLNGLPVLLGSALLIWAAVMSRRAARPGATPGAQRMAGLTTLAGAAFLVCAALMVALQVISWSAIYNPSDVVPGLEITADISYPAGLWVLLAAALMGAAAVVPTLRRVALPPAPEVDPDAPTPPFGLALPLPEEEPPLLTVDPLTGVPESPDPPPAEPLPPIVIPAAPPPSQLPPGPAVPLTDDPLADPRHD